MKNKFTAKKALFLKNVVRESPATGIKYMFTNAA